MKLTSWGGLGVALLASLAGYASAAPIAVTPDTLVFSVAGNIRFDDNRDATEQGKEAMTTLSFTPGARLTLDDLVTQTFISYTPALLWRDNPRPDQNESELYHAVEASVQHAPSYRLTLGAVNKFEMTDDPNVTQGGVTVRENASYWFNQTKGWLAYGVSERTQLSMDGSYLFKRYQDSQFADVGDEDRLELNSSLGYLLEPDYHVFAFVGYDQPTYKNSVRGDYKGYLGGVGVDRSFNEQLRGAMSLGYEFVDYSSSEDNSAMPYVLVSVEFKPVSCLKVEGTTEYSTQPSDRSLYASKENLRFSLRGTCALSESLSPYAQVVFDNGQYKVKHAVAGDSAALGQALVNGDDTLVDYQMGLLYCPKGSRYSGRVTYELEDWTSDVRESFTRNTLSVMVAVNF